MKGNVTRNMHGETGNFKPSPASGDSQQCTRMETTQSTALSELVCQAQQGREEAQREIITTYQHRVAGFVYAITGRSDSVEDLTQIVFIKMVRAIARLTQPAQFEAWLFRLARNTSIDHLRRQRWQRLFSPLDSEEHAEIAEVPSEVDQEELDALKHALSQLKPKDRALLALAQEGYSQIEMAQMTGTTVVALKTRLHRAREQLRQYYEHAS